MNHHGTQMNTYITNIHMNKCVMPQIQSLSECTCVYIYIINWIMYTFSLYIHTIYLIIGIVYVLSLHTHTYVCVKYDLIHKKTVNTYHPTHVVESYCSQEWANACITSWKWMYIWTIISHVWMHASQKYIWMNVTCHKFRLFLDLHVYGCIHIKIWICTISFFL